MAYERHMTKPTKWHVHPAKTQISLGIRTVWSESSLSAWRKLGSLATHWARSEDSDQTGWISRLIWVFSGRTCHIVGFVARRLKCVTTIIAGICISWHGICSICSLFAASVNCFLKYKLEWFTIHQLVGTVIFDKMMHLPMNFKMQICLFYVFYMWHLLQNGAVTWIRSPTVCPFMKLWYFSSFVNSVFFLFLFFLYILLHPLARIMSMCMRCHPVGLDDIWSDPLSTSIPYVC